MAILIACITTLTACQTTKFDIVRACHIYPPIRVENNLSKNDDHDAHVRKLIEMRGHINASDRKFKDVAECVTELTK